MKIENVKLKIFIIAFIDCYQKYVSPLLKQILGVQALCRYSPSCSAYTKQVIASHGVLAGTLLAFKRFLQCQPFGKTYEYI